MRDIPAQPRRIILVNPTRYLGNLLIAGGLIQAFAAYCNTQGISFRLVVDEAYSDLLAGAFSPETLLLYPRRQIAKAGIARKAGLYFQCLRAIRAFNADIAFNIEEDSVSHRLTQLSGAKFRLGCSSQRHSWGYEKVLPVSFTRRPAGQQHRWYSFQEVFAFLGLPASSPHYLKLGTDKLSSSTRQRLETLGVDFSKKLAVLHTGATKLYKKWPHANFAAVATQLQQAGYQVIFMGAGKDEADINTTLALIPEQIRLLLVNLCNQLTLAELAAFFLSVSVMVGNDSGPFHMAAAQGLTGIVIFGPTDVSLWGPLSNKTTVLQNNSVCSSQCTRQHCIYGHRCLKEITPDQVITALQSLKAETPAYDRGF